MKRMTKLGALVALVLALTAGLAVAGVPAVNPVDCQTDPEPECPGTSGNDDFTGEANDDGVQGANDIITGGDGRDGGDGNSGDDVMRGGAGADGSIIDFEGNDGEDLVAGGEGGDHELEGGSDDDTVTGGPGDDCEVAGDDGDDELDGGPGDDGDADTQVAGGTGDNTAHGGDGSDRIDADDSLAGDRERIFGDDGGDRIRAVDDRVDIINCGRGNDRVIFDAGIDTVRNCENRTAVTP